MSHTFVFNKYFPGALSQVRSALSQVRSDRAFAGSLGGGPGRRARRLRGRRVFCDVGTKLRLVSDVTALVDTPPSQVWGPVSLHPHPYVAAAGFLIFAILASGKSSFSFGTNILLCCAFY